MKKDRKKTLQRLGILVFGALVVCALAWQFVVSRMQTQTAVYITQNDSFYTSGWFFRNEVIANGTTSDTVKHIVQSGEKVQKNAALAVVYSSAQALETSQRVNMLNDQIELLQNAIQSAASGSDSVKIETEITTQIANLSGKVQQEVLSGVESNIVQLRNLCLRRGINNLDTSQLTSQVQTLTAERDYLQTQLSGQSMTITSPAAGFFSDVVDGFEYQLTLETLNTLTVQQLKDLDPSQVTNQAGTGGQLGKIIGDFRWYFAMAVPVEEVQNLSVGDSLQLRFAQVSGDIPVEITDIRKQKNAEEALLIVSGMQITPELVSMRYQSVEVIRKIYQGIRVPKSAVRIQQDSQGNVTQGVYILTGSLSRFKEITPIYETDTYYVVEQGTTVQNTGLVVGDTIIVKGKQLEDLKVVK